MEDTEVNSKNGATLPIPSPTPRRELGGTLEPTSGGLYLDPSDPFEAACIDLVSMNRKKRADYAMDGDPFSNFHQSAALLGMSGFGPVEAVLFNLSQKFARLSSLRKNGRMEETQNESVHDTYLDIAVYAVILYALVKSIS